MRAVIGIVDKDVILECLVETQGIQDVGGCRLGQMDDAGLGQIGQGNGVGGCDGDGVSAGGSEAVMADLATQDDETVSKNPYAKKTTGGIFLTLIKKKLPADKL